MRTAGVAILCLMGCATPPAADTDELVRRLMGRNDRLKLEIQLLTAPPIDEAAIRDRVLALARTLDELPVMPEKRAEAAAMLRTLANETWAGHADERFAALEQSCSVCHASIKSLKPRPRVDLRAWTAKPSMQACGSCHRAIYDEWRQTLHAGAWLDPVYRMSAGNPPRAECASCHSMEPVLATGIDVDYSWRPVFRDYNQDDGVGCVSCHLRADGTVAARRDADAPCKPRRDDRLKSPELCGACHNPSHDAYTEWKSSTYAKQGVDCSSCHSFPVLRTLADGSKKVGYSHAFPGGNSPEFVQRSVHAEVGLDKRALTIAIENRTGHKFPGEVPSRAFCVRLEMWDAQDAAKEPVEFWFKRPFKTQTGIPDNRLKPDERRVLRHDLAADVAFVRVTWFFKPSPLAMERAWVKMGTWEARVE